MDTWQEASPPEVQDAGQQDVCLSLWAAEAVKARTLRGAPAAETRLGMVPLGTGAHSFANPLDCMTVFCFSSGLGILQAAKNVTYFLFFNMRSHIAPVGP